MPNKADAMHVPLPWHDHGNCCLANPAHSEDVYTVCSTQIPCPSNAMTGALLDECMYTVAGKHLLIKNEARLSGEGEWRRRGGGEGLLLRLS